MSVPGSERRPRDFDVLIVGAGVIGTVMASLLVARKLVAPGRVAVLAPRAVEGAAAAAAAVRVGVSGATDTTAGATDTTAAAIDERWGLRVFTLSRASQRLLEICGVWPRLSAPLRFAYERMCVWDARGTPHGPASLTFDCAELNEPNLGFIVDGAELNLQAAAAAGASGAVFIDAGIVGLETAAAGVSVRLSDGRELGALALIGADGTDSATRGLLGIDTAGHAYDQDALVAHVRTALPHRNTAWQRFLPGGPLAFLPLPDARSSIVWSVGRTEAMALKALDTAGFNAALTRAGGGALGTCELTTPLASFPLKLQYALDYVRPRAVLLGDAAHAVHPLAGQGMNLGLLDCATLAECLGESGGADRFGEQRVLRRYERWRRSENLLAAAAFDGLERLFASENPGVAWLRATGLGAVGRMPFVRRQLAQRALGLSGDVPEFLRKGAGTAG